MTTAVKPNSHSLNSLAVSPLWRLDDAELSIARRSEDLRGRTLRDLRGCRLGKVDALYIDGGQKRVRFLRFGTGGLFGIGVTRFLVPVDAIRSADARDVFLELAAEHVFKAPVFDAKRVEQSSYVKSLYAYYGYPPFWTVGYRYPAFPYHPAPAQGT